jgi:hypothetical protein
MGSPAPPLWRCPTCSRRFANRNQTHSCANIVPLSSHFRGKPALTRSLFDAFLAQVKSSGPVTVLPEKSRIAFQARMSFAQLTPRRGYLRGHLVLARRCEHPCFERIETISPRNHVHHFELRNPGQIVMLEPFIAQAYAVGRQAHLKPRSNPH